MPRQPFPAIHHQTFRQTGGEASPDSGDLPSCPAYCRSPLPHVAGSPSSSRAADYSSGDKDGVHTPGATGHCWTYQPFTISAARCGKEPTEMTRDTCESPVQAEKLAVVTDASDGLGLHIPTSLAAAGAELILP